MIREFKAEDLEQINRIITSEDIIDKIDVIKDIKEKAKRFLVYEDNGIKGFAYISLRSEEDREWGLKFYVALKERRQGIGRSLYEEAFKYLKEEKPAVVIAEFRVDINDSTEFLKKLGYEKWFGCPNMIYRGNEKKDLDIDFVNYEDKYYRQYAKCRQEAFYELRKTYDFKPHIISESEEYREELLKDSNYTYLALDNERLIGCVTVKDGYIDHLMISPAYQGKGYGKKLGQFAINKALSDGIQPIYLCYIDGNEKADKLYSELGFEVLQIIDVYRKFL